MLKRRSRKGTSLVVVTFVLPDDHPGLPAAVVGDFNDWNPSSHRLRRRTNGTWSASATLEGGRRFRFRYRGDDGSWFNDDAADGYEPNDFQSTDCVVVT